MLAYRVKVMAEGSNCRRVTPIEDFLVDTFVTALELDRVFAELCSPLPGNASAWSMARASDLLGYVPAFSRQDDAESNRQYDAPHWQRFRWVPECRVI